jgi:hypothetical protein
MGYYVCDFGCWGGQVLADDDITKLLVVTVVEVLPLLAD